VMRQRRTASAILAGAGAIVLAVFLWPGGTGTPSPKRAPAKTSVADRVSLINVKIPSKALSAPTAIAAAGNRVWIANSFYRATNDAGWVTELNARTGALIRVISARRDGLTDPEAIAAAGNRVWVVNGSASTITELDAGGALIRVISGKRYQLDDPGAVTADENRVWVANLGRDSITEINARTGSLIRVITGKRYQLDSGGFAVAIAAGGNEIWVPNANGNSVTEINATTGALIRVISAKGYQLNGPVEVAVTGNRVWVVSSSSANCSVTEINATTGALIRVITSLPNYSFATVAGGSGVWFVTNVGVKGVDGSGPAGSITDLSAATGQLVHNIAATPFATSYPGGAITAAGGHVWVADTNFYSAAGWVAELSAATGVLTRVISG
jgi:DNA-binding beta-propeller fold protein YncE